MIKLNDVHILSDLLEFEGDITTVFIQADSYMSNDAGVVRVVVSSKAFHQIATHLRSLTKYIDGVSEESEP